MGPLRRLIETTGAYFIRSRRVALFYALLAFIVLLAFWLYIGTWVEERLSHDERERVFAQVDTIGASLTLAINQRIMMTTAVHSYMSAEVKQHENFSFKNPDQKIEVDDFASGLNSRVAGIRNIAIAPDGVMRYVYPYEANKSVLGYDPTKDERPNVREEVRRAIETGEIVLSLPYELIQGGQGLIARQAINVNGRYWGLVNVVLDIPPLLEEAGLDPMPKELQLALYDQTGQLFYGSKDIYALDPVTYRIELPEGSWELAGIPQSGWEMANLPILWSYRIMGLTGIIAISLVIYLYVNRGERLAYLVDQRTQELEQANQTLINVLEGINADVYVADFETHEILFANKHIRESFMNDPLVGKICYKVFRHETSVCADCKNKLLLDTNGQSADVVVWEGKNQITNRWYTNADRAIRWKDGRYVHLQIATDITELKQAADAIRESEERYRNLFDSVPVGIYRSTPAGRFLDGNPALIKILGYPDQATMLAANIRERYVDKSVREEELGVLEQDDLISNYRLQLRRYDGAIIWVQDSSNAVRNSSGEVMYYYGRLEDVTERVLAEQTLLEAENNLKALVREKDVLLAEVHHRVKNNMQVIASLLNLQASQISDETLQAVYQESRTRINSMSLIHEQFYRSKEFARIEFEPYIDQLVTSLCSAYDVDPAQVQFHFAADNVYIDLERAIPCGLLLNELITNSLKYAFPDGREGKIWITLLPENNTMTLKFCDNGIGLPAYLDLENPKSLGLQLVRLLVNHDLQGTLDISTSQGNSTTFSIKFPFS